MPAMTIQNYTDSGILILADWGLVVYRDAHLAFISLSESATMLTGASMAHTWTKGRKIAVLRIKRGR